MKKIPTKPPLLEALSALFIQELGKVKSKAPKKEAANTRIRRINSLMNKIKENPSKIEYYEEEIDDIRNNYLNMYNN